MAWKRPEREPDRVLAFSADDVLHALCEQATKRGEPSGRVSAELDIDLESEHAFAVVRIWHKNGGG